MNVEVIMSEDRTPDQNFGHIMIFIAYKNITVHLTAVKVITSGVLIALIFQASPFHIPSIVYRPLSSIQKKKKKWSSTRIVGKVTVLIKATLSRKVPFGMR